MKKRRLSTIILILLFLAGLSLLLYPTVSNYWNSLHQTEAIAEYTGQVEDLDSDRCEQLWAEAESYNQSLRQKEDRYHLSEKEQEEYERLLNVSDNGIIGYIEIPVIDCLLPVYHGTDEAVLKNLQEGDIVIFTDMDGNEFVYEITLLETLSSSDVEGMENGDWDLTLFTCTIGGSYRITVRCELIPE